MTPFQLYVLLKMDTISVCICCLSIPFWILFIVYLIIMIVGHTCVDNNKCYGENDNDYKKGKSYINASLKPIYVCFIVGFFISTIASLIPSTKQMAAIIVVPKIITSIENNKELMSLPGEITSLATAWIKELKPKSDTTTTESK